MSTALQIARSRGASTTILAAREPLARPSQPPPVRVTYPGSPGEGAGGWGGTVSDTGAGAAAESAQGARGGVGSRGSAVTVVLQPVRAAHSD